HYIGHQLAILSQKHSSNIPVKISLAKYAQANQKRPSKRRLAYRRRSNCTRSQSAILRNQSGTIFGCDRASFCAARKPFLEGPPPLRFYFPSTRSVRGRQVVAIWPGHHMLRQPHDREGRRAVEGRICRR